MIVGEIEAVEGSVKLNEGRVTQSITVTNSGDRPVQVGSHYHFFESNSALKFERDSCRGFRGTRPTQDSDSVCQACGGTQDVRRPGHPSSLACELRWGHSRHLCRFHCGIPFDAGIGLSRNRLDAKHDLAAPTGVSSL